MANTYPGEKLLLKVIGDLVDFLPYLVLVGGWVPYIYAKYVWKNAANLAVTTADIDFGVGNKDYKGKESIASCVRRLGYAEHHVSMDRLVPFVPVAKDTNGLLKAEVEFIADPTLSKNIRDKIVGREIKVNEIENFSILLESVKTVSINGYKIQVPAEPIFVFHKLLTFIQRENKEKLRKDLYYAYYMLRFSPEDEGLAKKVKSLINDKTEGKSIKQNIRQYFNRPDSQGPVLIEQENGPDKYIDDLRQDIFERFKKLQTAIV